MHLGSKSPIYDAILIAHVVAAIGGFGANGLAGMYAGQLLPSPSESALRYFSSTKFVAEKLIYLVPVFGLAMISISHGTQELLKPWVLVGMLAWLLAIAVAHAVVWPLERKIHIALLSQPSQGELRVLSKRLSRGALILDVVFVFTFIEMIVQVGGK